MKPKAPCKDCPDKGCGRHSSCQMYIEYKDKVEEWNKVHRRHIAEEYTMNHSSRIRNRMIKAGRYKDIRSS